MNTTVIAPEVQDFLAAVRRQLADLDPDEQREILDGLEADLTDLVAERGGEALGDPVLYAHELRAAAGLRPEMGRVRRGMSLSEGLHSFLDDAHRRFGRLLASLPGDASGIVAALQPAWWVLRAWVAVEVAALLLGEWALQVIPGQNLPGAVALLVAVVLSVQLGRDALPPVGRWRAAAGLRALLLGLNVFALVMVPVVANGLGHHEAFGSNRAYEIGYQDGARSIREATAKSGLVSKGRVVSNLYPYDAAGQPLVGVQLFDQDGKPLDVVTEPRYHDDLDNADGRPWVFYPWSNGTTQLLNVFPVPSRVQDSKKPSATAFSEAVPPAIAPFPLASVPSVSLPGITPSVVRPSR